MYFNSSLYYNLGQQLELLLAQKSKNDAYERVVLLSRSTLQQQNISSVVPGDFDGDAQMDILVTMKSDDGKGVTVQVFWGKDYQSLGKTPILSH